MRLVRPPTIEDVLARAEWMTRLDMVLHSWLGTPWVAGQQLRGRAGGVDCVRFVIAVLDELHACIPAWAAEAHAGIPRLPQDMSLHDRAGAMRVARAIEQRYPHRLIDAHEQIEPGDVLVFTMGQAGGPGHVAIAGGDPRQLWHACAGAGVCRTSAAAGGNIVRIWRPTESAQWA